MCRIELSGFWIDKIGRTMIFSVIAVITLIVAINLIRVIIRDWNEVETTVNIAVLVLAIFTLCITFNALYVILNVWGILEIVIV